MKFAIVRECLSRIPVSVRRIEHTQATGDASPMDWELILNFDDLYVNWVSSVFRKWRKEGFPERCSLPA